MYVCVFPYAHMTHDMTHAYVHEYVYAKRLQNYSVITLSVDLS